MIEKTIKPLVSIVIATYNGVEFLHEQMESLIHQTYPNIEIIAIDDCSQDSTIDILNEYAKNYRNVNVHFNETNLGYIKNFEKGMLLAKGELIALSDQDDIWNLEKIDVLVNQIGNHEIIYSNSNLIDAQGKCLQKKMSDIKNQIGYDDCLMYTIGAWAPGHAMLFKKELVERCMPFPKIVTHDFWLGFNAACFGPIKYINATLVQYRQHSQNAIGAITGNKKKQKKEILQHKQKLIRDRLLLLYIQCPQNIQQKKVLLDISNSYQSFSIKNNFNRLCIFYRHRKKILAYKKKNELQKKLFCLKMFFKID